MRLTTNWICQRCGCVRSSRECEGCVKQMNDCREAFEVLCFDVEKMPIECLKRAVVIARDLLRDSSK